MEWTVHFQCSLKNVQKVLAEQGGLESARKVEDLLVRFRTGQDKTYVVFCGLFSAGKSSLLNRLSAEARLATGAVPTTSGIAEVTLKESAGQIVLMDTPGVDSTDESHQAATEGALHQADVVAVVMDYQHVESDANLELARSFSEQGSRLWLIVNQIDKHVDWELPFSEFQMRIEQTFADWDIHYEQLFYTSSEDCDYNQIDSLAQSLQGLTEGSAEDLEHSIQVRVHELIADHVEQLLSLRREAVENNVLAKIGMLPFNREEAEQLYRNREEKQLALKQQVQSELAEFDKAQRIVREEFVRSVELAQVAPYETTEKGRLYIESLQPGFKVGWWRAGERTAQEQEARLTQFVQDLAQRTDKFLVLPLTNQLQQFVQKTPWAEAEWQSDVSTVKCEVTPALCKGVVRQGALVSNQYPYQYVKDVVAALKRQVFGSLTNVLDKWFESAVEHKEQELHERYAEMAQLEEELASLREWFEFQEERSARIREIAADAAEEVRN